MIYLITDGEYIKIGFSECPELRIESLQTASPRKLEVLAIMPGNTSTEAVLHKRFAHLRVRGEWFRTSAELLRFAKGHSVSELPKKIYRAVNVSTFEVTTSFCLTALRDILDRYQASGGAVQFVNLPEHDGMGIFFPDTTVRNGEFTLVEKAVQP